MRVSMEVCFKWLQFDKFACQVNQFSSMQVNKDVVMWLKETHRQSSCNVVKLTCICMCQRVTYFKFHCGGIFMGHLLSVKGWVSWVPNRLSLLMFICFACMVIRRGSIKYACCLGYNKSQSFCLTFVQCPISSYCSNIPKTRDQL